jgi:hypothetical protein
MQITDKLLKWQNESLLLALFSAVVISFKSWECALGIVLASVANYIDFCSFVKRKLNMARN